MNLIRVLLAASVLAPLHAPLAPAQVPLRAKGDIPRRARQAIERRRRARGSLAVVAFVLGRPFRRLVSVEHYNVLARPTVDVRPRPVAGLAVVRLPSNGSTLRDGRLVEGVVPPRREGLPRGRSVWLGVRDESGVLRARACLELDPERGTHRGWNPPLHAGEAATSGLWVDPAVRQRGAAKLLLESLIAMARDEYGMSTVYGIVHRYNTVSMLLMRVMTGFTVVGDAWVLRLVAARIPLRGALRRGASS